MDSDEIVEHRGSPLRSSSKENKMEGVYVLWDGSGFYVGETGDLDERMEFHRREGRELLSFVPVEGGAFARRREEAMVIEAFRSMGQPITNPRPRCYDSIGRRDRRGK
jgi:hypothetical protein